MIRILAITSLFLVSAITGPKVVAEGTLASTLEVYVFPKDGQNDTDQSKAESECYGWATKNSGVDPFETKKNEAQQQQQAAQQKENAKNAGQGSRARGALRGAAVGALIGEIADDDAGDGAGWGATAGFVRGGQRKRQAQAQAENSADRSAARSSQASAAEIEKFKKAFSVCLEAKDYLVKY